MGENKRSRGSYGKVAALMGIPTRKHSPSTAALHAAGVIEIFRRNASSVLLHDAQQVKATGKAVDALGGEAVGYRYIFEGYLDTLTGALASQSRDALRDIKVMKAISDDEVKGAATLSSARPAVVA